MVFMLEIMVDVWEIYSWSPPASHPDNLGARNAFEKLSLGAPEMLRCEARHMTSVTWMFHDMFDMNDIHDY